MNRSNFTGRLYRGAIFVMAFGTFAGCAGRASLLPNSDPALRKTSTAFAVDAASRFPYKADAPSGGAAIARAEIGYMLKRIDLVNNSADTWTNVEVWLNEKYVVFIPTMKPHDLKELPFQMFFDNQGNYFPRENSTPSEALVKEIELYMGGKLYTVPLQLPDH
jgi:hypothetical protein